MTTDIKSSLPDQIGDLESGQQQAQANVAGPGLSLLFENKKIRLSFLRKVYSMVAVQLFLTSAIVSIFVLHKGMKLWAQENPWFQLVAWLVSLGILIAICVSPRLQRKHPYNIFMLFAFTLAQALMLSAITVYYDTQIIVVAGGLTALICGALTLFAIQTRWDFTAKLGIVYVIFLVGFIALLVAPFVPASKYLTLGLAAFMAIVTGIFLVIDVQMIIGGTHAIQMSPEEYIFAALNIYIDIVNMFLFMLAILSGGSRGN